MPGATMPAWHVLLKSLINQLTAQSMAPTTLPPLKTTSLPSSVPPPPSARSENNPNTNKK
ncbi:hypothetical protein D8674_014920 [Pyrus ussuriensis x Pyrus communis]|uniref:Uncharacterized protein n=1 Tax=Pyrus ussuriensis x Pyrus communis TaxID=2448454 RepID=A0A5N5GYT6_9ROSA|nr:hypothetical protein D8674_014920 [Pyrus ussuriensis x Pyrus communis]